MPQNQQVWCTLCYQQECLHPEIWQNPRFIRISITTEQARPKICHYMLRLQSLYLYISMYNRIAMQILQSLQNLLSVFLNDLINSNTYDGLVLFHYELTSIASHTDWWLLTGSGNEPSFPRSDWMDPPGTNSSKIFSVSSSRTVPRYLFPYQTE